MSKRIPCKQCGTQVLEVILKSNSGICLSCYNPNITLDFLEGREDCSDVDFIKALQVVQQSALYTFGDGENKVLSLLLRKGESDVKITKHNIAIRYSWLRWKPSTYFIDLAPGVVGKLMELGGVKKVAQESSFKIKKGREGIGRYLFFHTKKWVRIICHEDSIEIKVRDKEKRLDEELQIKS